MAFVNYFSGTGVAARYQAARPGFHRLALERIQQLSARSSFGCALDVGCGTGNSTVALAGVADEVIGIDPSEEMLGEARAFLESPASHSLGTSKIRYELGRAEELGFADQSFELVTVGLALHWFEQSRFFAEVKRVLAPGGLLAIYNDHFTAHMRDDSTCKQWMRTRFAKRFPQPRRGLRDVDEQLAAESGFAVEARDSFEHTVLYTRPEFVAYLMTRSHTIAPVLAGCESEESVRGWLDAELASLLPDGRVGEFIFKCNLWLTHPVRS